MSLERDGGRRSKRRRSKWRRERKQVAKSDRARAESDGTSGVELMEQVTERARWTAMEQATESETRDRTGNRCSSMVQGWLIGSQTGFMLSKFLYIKG
ncbi:hypothetical protein HID58_061681 [Brassica napus]|uniref:BnaA02g19100D protein n=3 Tax=Brassica TaxID=3705 RepID=A0A078GK10_BRANA|nr:hypothetical protein HID58_095709 [Brassica napus]KAH0885585.1 hypothetical protein HID58_061681 [Brassica napus]CAF2140801.1 unnamed protein product [Brassica napus]CAG7893864.1 unnamed protein product [Brassica rapa]CDY26885.1 BnaA02g19100D [Brassica napus]